MPNVRDIRCLGKSAKLSFLAVLSVAGRDVKVSEVVEMTKLPAGTVRPTMRTLVDKGFLTDSSYGLYRSTISLAEVLAHLLEDEE